MVYVSLVRSLMEYCSTVWDPHLQRDIHKLEDIHISRGTTLLGSQDVSQPCCLNLTCELFKNAERNSGCSSCSLQGGHWTVPSYTSRGLHHHRQEQKRPVRPRTTREYEKQNSVAQFARNNSHCFQVETGKRDICKNSLFPRTVRDWNNIDKSTVSANSIEEFKDFLSIPDQN